MDPITRATHEWAAAKVGTTADNVKDVEFAVIQNGLCETCGYTTCGVHVSLKRGHSLEHDLNYESMADVVREISALVKP